MLSLHTNAASLNTMNSMGSTNKTLSSSMTKLGTGYRVNSAMDDAAGLQIATRLNAQSRGMSVAQKNTQNGISMMQTAEGSMSEINNMLLRMKDLATESANGTSSADDRKALQAEYAALGSEISNILKNTTFAGQNLFSDTNGKIGNAGALSASGALGDANGITFQVGASEKETVNLSANANGGSLNELMKKLQAVSANIGEPVAAAGAPTAPTTNGLKPAAAVLQFFAGKTDAEIDALDWSETDATAAGFIAAADKTALFGDTETDFDNAVAWAKYENAVLAASTKGEIGDTGTAASQMITKLTDAINAVGTFRSDLGAVANRLEHTYNNLSNMITNTEAAKGRILDVDYAKESATMTKNQMLMQVSTSMLKQSNSLSQMVGSLVQ